MEKIAESLNRVFLVTFQNDQQVIARIPVLLTSPLPAKSLYHGLSDTLRDRDPGTESPCLELASPVNGSRIGIHHHGKGERSTSH